ncbi:hypothetical protein EXIGLDRAFT_773141 [Exidia glandulosa HHB12029]|uniref:Uncharacterized protein n=1 Tax=Exidia glandulosa HHB12029 TaxID=1314781 RepID=A0A165EXI1_EXIGL|nr:hypothetical protein EXIGLDRAFT_773141 [Exidia glandulosa HHB12029]
MSSYTVKPELMSRADFYLCIAWATACDDAMAGTGNWPRDLAPAGYEAFQSANPSAIHLAAGNAIVKMKTARRDENVPPARAESPSASTGIDGMFRELMHTHRDMIHTLLPSPSAPPPPRSPFGMRTNGSRQGHGGRHADDDRAPVRGQRSGRGRAPPARPVETNAQRRERLRREALMQEIEAGEMRQQQMEREITHLRQRFASPPPVYAAAATFAAPAPPPPPPPAANTPAVAEDFNDGDGDYAMRDVMPAADAPPRFPPGLPIPRAFTAPPVLPANDATQARNGEEVFAYDLHAVQNAFAPEVRITPTEFQWTDLFDGTFANHLVESLGDNALGLQEGVENLDISSPGDDDDVIMRFISPEVMHADVGDATIVRARSDGLQGSKGTL